MLPIAVGTGVPADFAFWALVLAALTFAVMKGMERFGWLRTPTAWKTEAEALQRECDRLNIRIVVLETDLMTLKGENAELRSRPDVSALYQLMQEHDGREAENHAATLAAFTAITKTLEALAKGGTR